jgi:hypothetical protein
MFSECSLNVPWMFPASPYEDTNNPLGWGG